MAVRTSALILAAGASRRLRGMAGEPKSLIHLHGRSVLGHCIALFRDAGVTDILVVAPAGSPVAVEAEVHGAGVAAGPPPGSDMFASVQCGVAVLSRSTEALFVLPADMPLVLPSTVRLLVHAFAAQERMIVHPCSHGRRGHPPLLSARLVPSILSWTAEGGLRAVLARHDHEALDVEVDDPGIHLDLDTPEDLEAALGRMEGRKNLSCRPHPGWRACEGQAV